MALLTTLGTALLLASPVAPAPQEPEEPQPWTPGTDLELRLLNQYGNFHVAVVGEEMISRIDVFAWMDGRRFEDPTIDQPDLDPQKRQALQTSAAVTQLIEHRLKIQGGRSQGYEEELIEAERERSFRNGVERMGGSQAAAVQFERMGITPQEYKELLGEGLMANLWERSITGLTPGSTGRIYVDSFLRPGQLWARNREYVESRDPKVNEIVGRNRQGRVSIQRIVLLVTAGGPPAESVRVEIETVRQRIEDEVLTFEEAINRFAPPELRGKESVIPDASIAKLKSVFENQFTTQIDEVNAFVETAAAGEMSPILEFNATGVPQAYVLLRIVDRKKATEALPFTSLELQTRLREAVAKEASEVRVSRGLAELVRTTHLAPEELRSSFLSAGRRLRSN